MIPLIDYIPLNFSAPPKQESGFPTTYVLSCFCSTIWGEVIVCFVEIIWVVDQHCLNIFYIVKKKTVENTNLASKKWTKQRNWQHRVNKTKKNTTQYVMDTTIYKTNSNKVNKTWSLLQTTEGNIWINQQHIWYIMKQENLVKCQVIFKFIKQDVLT